MSGTARLLVNGRTYSGWTEVRITRGLEVVPGAFSLSVSERWSGQAERWPIREGDACQVVVDRDPPLESEPVITGYVDQVSMAFDASTHTLAVTGRDKMADLVDSSAGTGQFNGRIGLEDLARTVAEPFGVDVSVQSVLTLSPLQPTIAINPGESAIEVLDRLCRQAGVLPVPDGRGGLLLTRSGTVRATTALIEGENILSARVDYDASRRYRRYTVTGQSPGTDFKYGEAAASIRGRAEDQGARATRALLIVANGALTPEYATAQAEWEAKVRAARAEAVSVTVQGWHQRDGTVWPMNALVSVKSPALDVDAELLIVETTFELSLQGGTTTTMRLMSADAFTPEPVIPKKDRHSGKSVIEE